MSNKNWQKILFVIIIIVVVGTIAVFVSSYQRKQNELVKQKSLEGVQALGLAIIADIPMTGGANRFDYQSINAQSNRLYISHMGSNMVTVFDLSNGKIIADIKDISRPTGIVAIPELGKVYVSASGDDQLIVIDEKTLQITKHIQTGQFPDGIAYDPTTKKIFVSNEYGEEVTVVDAMSDKFITNIAMNGEVGNTHYDPVDKLIYSAVHGVNQLVVIDPVNEKIISHYDMPNCGNPHGFYIDPATHYALITCEAGNQFVVFDLTSKSVIYNDTVGSGPDVLAFDTGLHRLYVAGEGGVVSVFQIESNSIKKLSQNFIANNAHTVSVDQPTHTLYLPLENVDGRPVLRLLRPAAK